MTATQVPSRLTAREWSLDAYRCLSPLLASADVVISTVWPSAIKHLHICVCNTLRKPPPFCSAHRDADLHRNDLAPAL